MRVDVKADERFQRDGYDLVHILNISMVQASLGAHIKLKTFDGAEDIYVDAGTQNGKVFKFRGKGVPVLNSRSRGDLIVRVAVDTPAKLTDEQEALLRQFAQLRGEDVAEGDHGFLGKIKDAFK